MDSKSLILTFLTFVFKIMGRYWTWPIFSICRYANAENNSHNPLSVSRNASV